MYTQCPTCQTLFRIRAEQLRAANGQAHCCRCDQVFNALEHLRESATTSNSPIGAPRTSWQPDTPDEEKPLEQLLEELEQEWQEPEPLTFNFSELTTQALDTQELTNSWRPGADLENSAPGADEAETEIRPAPESDPQTRDEPSPADSGSHELKTQVQAPLDLIFQGPGDEGSTRDGEANPNSPAEVVEQLPEGSSELANSTKPPNRDSTAPAAAMADDPAGFEQLSDYPGETELGDYLEPGGTTSLTQDTTADDDPAGFEQLSDYPGETELGDYLEPTVATPPPETDPGEEIGSTEPAVPFNLDTGVDPISATETALEQEPLTLQALLEKQEAPPRRHTTLWVLIILGLLLLALTQAAWLGRERLMAYEEGRWLLQTGCRYLGCQLPPRRAPEQFEVINRSLMVLPDKPGILQVTLEFRNQAAFDQPLPAIQLQLFGNMSAPLARRTFLPAEYAPDLGPDQTIASGMTQRVELQLKDPGPQVSGFRFDFR